jgi:hypothetical protein
VNGFKAVKEAVSVEDYAATLTPPPPLPYPWPR